MSTDRPIIAIHEITQADLVPGPNSEPEGSQRGTVSEPVPLDWDIAVRAAGVLLDERFGPPGSCDDPAMTSMAHELAARLCAYNEIIEVVENMNDHLPDPAAGSSR